MMEVFIFPTKLFTVIVSIDDFVSVMVNIGKEADMVAIVSDSSAFESADDEVSVLIDFLF